MSHFASSVGVGLACTAVVVGLGFACVSISTIPAGYVGVRVNLYSDKGVQNEVVGTGRYFLGLNEKMYEFPTFNQLVNFEAPFSFQTSDAMAMQARVGVEYNIDPEKASTVFATYRKGIEEITEVNIRQYVSDALIKNAAKQDINDLTQGGKTKLLDNSLADIRAKLEPTGIRVVKLSWVSDIEYPARVRESINAKIEATQRALLRENEVAQSRAEAQKQIEAAKGVAESTRLQAQAEADAITIKAKAEADAIAMKARAIANNPSVIQLNAIERWDGKLPTYMTSGAATPFVQVK